MMPRDMFKLGWIFYQVLVQNNINNIVFILQIQINVLLFFSPQSTVIIVLWLVKFG